jgi:uncharacterized protein YigE (DUF2233 family)
MRPSLPTKRLRCNLMLRLLALVGASVLSASCNYQVQPMESREVTFQGQDFTVVSLDLHREKLSLHWRDPDNDQPFSDIQTLREWGAANGKRLMFAANAGIYDQSYAPLGLYVENGKTLVPHQPQLQGGWQAGRLGHAIRSDVGDRRTNQPAVHR